MFTKLRSRVLRNCAIRDLDSNFLVTIMRERGNSEWKIWRRSKLQLLLFLFNRLSDRLTIALTVTLKLYFLRLGNETKETACK